MNVTISSRYAWAAITAWIICKYFAACIIKPNTRDGRELSMLEDLSKVRDTIMRLSELTDLIGLRQCIIEGTNKGRTLVEGDAWYNTRAAMREYANPDNTERVIALFEAAGCHNEIEAVRWILRHDKLVT